jgi:hypothetical protein
MRPIKDSDRASESPKPPTRTAPFGNCMPRAANSAITSSRFLSIWQPPIPRIQTFAKSFARGLSTIDRTLSNVSFWPATARRGRQRPTRRCRSIRWGSTGGNQNSHSRSHKRRFPDQIWCSGATTWHGHMWLYFCDSIPRLAMKNALSAASVITLTPAAWQW